MAIYHLTVKNISRGQGRSAVAAAAYRRAARLFDARLNCYHDFSDKPDVIHRELSIPNNAPIWAKELKALDATDKVQSSEILWNKVERQERRVDARLAKEIEFALPIELNEEQAISLAREFIQDQCAGLGMIADWSVHWDSGNPHVHVMLTTRVLTAEGFGLKVRAWNDEKLIQNWREQWGQYANFHLALHQHDVKIDHRSYQAQGIELVPGIHRGRAVIEMAQKGKPTQILKESNAIQAENLQRIIEKPSIVLEKITHERAAFCMEDVAYELGRYIPSKHSIPRQTVVLNLHGDHTFSHQDLYGIREKLLAALNHNAQDDSNQSLLTPETITELLAKIEHFDSVFGERELSKALLAYTESAEQFARLLVALKQSDQLVALGVGNDGRERYTTRRMFELENKIQTLADNLRNRKHSAISLRKQNQILKAYQTRIGKALTQEQLGAVKHVLSKSALTCMVGRAGTGKSFTLGAAREIWEAQSRRVLGVALSGIAADGLSKDAGIASRTIESFKLALAAKQIILNKNDVIVMDEAGMTDSIAMATVLAAVEQAGAKLVLAGDPAQLQPVGPGASFRALVERIGFIELQQVYRQREAWAAKATVEFSKGQTDKALNAYYQQGCIHLLEDESQTKAKLIADWQQLKKTSGKSFSELLIIAHRNEDVMALNHLARQTRINQVELQPGYLVKTHLSSIEISQGDRILFLKNDRKLGVANGRFATIERIELSEAGKVLSITALLDGDKNQKVTFSPESYNHFTYGYAATVHKVQGLTVDHSFTYAGGLGWNRHLTYVAKSRHRYGSHLYAAKTTHTTYEKLKRRLSRYALKDSVLDYPLGFSERRGMAADSVREKISSHLAARLKGFKKTLAETYEQIAHPQDYWKRREALLKIKLNQETILARREAAKLVAAYIEANKACGKAWQVCNLKLQPLSIESLDYTSDPLKVFKDTDEYQTFKATINERNHLASRIWVKQDCYQKALEVCNIDLAKLEREAKQHVNLERVKTYITECANGRIIHRDMIATAIFADFKGHYHYLKEANIDVSQIKQSAQAHLRRKLLSHLNSQNRHYFKEVETYRELNKAVIRLKKDVQNASSQNLWARQNKLEVLDNLSAERNALANKIYTHESTYQLALNFYEIGTITNKTSFENALKQANARWYRLQQHAMRHVINPSVEHSQAVFNSSGDKSFTLYQVLESKLQPAESVDWQMLVMQSQPIAGTLGAQYFKEQCGFEDELPRHLHYHPLVWEPDTQNHFPAILSHAIGRDGQAKGVQIIYLDPNTAHKANISNPIRFAQGQEKEAYIPIQKGVATDDRWFVALSIESALTIAKANPTLRVFCASSYEDLANPPFKGQGNALIICADKTHSLAEIKKSSQILAAYGFDVYEVKPAKANDFNSLYKFEGKEAVIKQLDKLKALAKAKSKATIDVKQQKVLVEAAKELARLEKVLKEAKENLPYAFQVQAKEALVKFVTNLHKDPILFKQLKLSDPKINKHLNLIIKSEQEREL